MKIWEQITEAKWRKAYSDKGRLTMTDWLIVVYPPPDTRPYWLRVAAAAGVTLEGPFGQLSAWEALPETTFQDVLTAFKEADV